MIVKFVRRSLSVSVALAMVVPSGPSWSREAARSASTEANATSDPLEWPRFLLDSPAQFRPGAPPGRRSATTSRELRELRRLQDARTKSVRRRVRFWNAGAPTIPWTKVALDMMVAHRPRPPFAARGLAMLHSAMYDAYIAARDTRRAYDRVAPSKLDSRIRPLLDVSGSTYVPEQAAIAGAAEVVLQEVFPNQRPGTFEELATEAVESRLHAGVNYRSDVRRGRALGRAVANLYLVRAEADGHTNSGPAHPRPEGEQYWSPTPPRFEPLTGGPVGTWLPWVMTSPDEARTRSQLPGPYSYGSPQFMAELDEVLDVQANLSPQEQEIAIFWDDGPGSFTPPGHWNAIALDLLASHPLSSAETVRLFGLLNVALADAAIANFEAKYFWWSIRPITAARRLCDGDTRLCTVAELEADPSRADHPTWLSDIETPPFPSYPGGHSTFSGASGRVLEAFFPSADGVIDEQANEAAMSRLFGGIHFRSDNDAGLTLGRTVAQMVLDWSQGLRD
jgi:hypothetical protein